MITHSKFLLLIFLLCSCQEMFKSKQDLGNKNDSLSVSRKMILKKENELYYKKRTDSLNANRRMWQDTIVKIPKCKIVTPKKKPKCLDKYWK